MRVAFFIALFAVVFIYALRRGGAPEKATAFTMLFMGAADPFVHMFTPAVYSELDPGHFIIDFLCWMAFLVIAVRARRIWPLWVGSLQSIALVAHVTRFLDIAIHPVAYGIMQVAFSYPLLVILGIGTYHHQKRMKANGTDPSWRS